MSLIISFLKSQKIMIAAGVFLVIVLIFVFGGKLGLTTTERILISVLVLFLYFIWYLFTLMKEAKNAGNIEQSIGSQADDQMQSLRPEKKAEIEQFKIQLEAAINSLKKSKLGRGKIGKSALYALPWYMFIGPPAAGKTTAIQNSGLEFPFGNDGLRGVGGTRNCDWFFSNRAIFLDTAGRYTTETEDRPEWISFLEILKKNRRKKPINGVMIGIGIDEIINAEPEALETHAKNIRQRTDELIEHLGIRFPVYLVFTKCDLLQGFVEYFGDFSHGERSQIWGSTLSRDQQNNPDLRNIFLQEFKKLYKVLFEMQRSRLSLPLKREQRRRVFLFPQQFNSLKEKLEFFVTELFQPNPYQDSPIFRGFYFTSGTQEGIPINLAIEKIARQFNLPSLPDEGGESQFETKNYFIRELFSNVLINDQNYLVGQTSRIGKQKRILRLAVIALSTIFLGLFIIAVSQDFVSSQIQLNKISASVENTKGIDWKNDFYELFSSTDELRETIIQLSNEKEESSFFDWGMKRGTDLLTPAQKLYFSKFHSFADEYIFLQLQNKLRRFVSGQEYPYEQIYKTLKAYLLVGDEYKRLDKEYTNFLLTQFLEEIDERLIRSIHESASNKKESLKILVKDYLKYTMSNLGTAGNSPIKNDVNLVNNVRKMLLGRLSIENVYSNIKQRGLDVLQQSIKIQNLIGSNNYLSVQNDFEIPEYYTKNGWNSFVKNEIESASENPHREDWVLGSSIQKYLPENMRNKDIMKKNLQNYYFAEYNKIWWQFLRNIEFYEPGSVSSAAKFMENISTPTLSPLVLILKQVVKETTFEEKIIDITVAVDQKPVVNSPTHAVDKEFLRLHKFVFTSPESEALGEIEKIISQYSDLFAKLDELSGNNEACKFYAAQLINKQADELPLALNEVRGTLSGPLSVLRNIFESPVYLSWNAILINAQEYLNKHWRIKVYDEFNSSLANYYPFRSDGNDAPLADFENFFSPGNGVLTNFYDEELADFINRSTLKSKRWKGRGIALSKEMKNALSFADEIGKTMFDGNVLGISFQIKPKQPKSNPVNNKKPIVEQMYYNINGYEDKYYMGASYWKDIQWPLIRDRIGVNLNISIRGIGSVQEKKLDGEWALFRLLELASIERISSRLYNISWTFFKQNSYNVRVSYELRAGSTINPFKQGYLKLFRLPKKIN